ncbi:MAG: Imm17 family immunity protein [Chloroflexales bacterium]|nr:Imm17 family immunity protein [Chloroflexales bacterium]
MDQAIVMLVFISGLGVLALLGAIYDWEWMYRARGSRLLVRLIGRPATRVLNGIAGVIFLVGPWLFVLTRP